MGGMVPDFFKFFMVVERNKGFVLVELFESFYGFYRVCVDDAIPYSVLPLPFGHIPDKFIHDHEFRHGCHIET